MSIDLKIPKKRGRYDNLIPESVENFYVRIKIQSQIDEKHFPGVYEVRLRSEDQIYASIVQSTNEFMIYLIVRNPL